MLSVSITVIILMAIENDHFVGNNVNTIVDSSENNDDKIQKKALLDLYSHHLDTHGTVQILSKPKSISRT